MKQKENESLWDFITRFNVAILEVSDLDPMVAMSAMKGSLKFSRFLFSLEKRFSSSKEVRQCRGSHVGQKEFEHPLI